MFGCRALLDQKQEVKDFENMQLLVNKVHMLLLLTICNKWEGWRGWGGIDEVGDWG